MRTFINLFLCSFIFCSCATQQSSPNRRPSREIASRPSLTPYQVGEIKASLLYPEQFRARYGSVWTPMDGRDVSGTAYAVLTGNQNLPDARGKFLRMVNADAKCRGSKENCQYNPSNKALGSYQSDSLQHHQHSFRYHNSKTTGSRPHSNFEYPTNRGNSKIVTRKGEDGRFSHETRPKNISVYYYVKVESCSTEEDQCL